MTAAETVRVGFFHVLVVYLEYGPQVGKPPMPVSLFLEASRIAKLIQALEHAVSYIVYLVASAGFLMATGTCTLSVLSNNHFRG